MEQKPRTEADAIIDITRQSSARAMTNPHADGTGFVVIPTDHKIEYLERPATPQRMKGIVNLLDANSFVQFFQANKGTSNAIYAAMEPAHFVAILNEHNKEGADWRDFGCEYAPAFSKEWMAWAAMNKKPFDGNEAFAVWLEDNLTDVIVPANGEMLEIALNFRIHSNAAFSNAIRLNDGNTEFNFTDQIEGSSTGRAGKVQIPEMFTLQVPVFAGRDQPHYEIKARFRYRLNNGALKIWYELIRPHKVVEEAFMIIVKKIESETGSVVMLGTPTAR